MLDMLDSHLGQAAGLATSVLWTATSLFFTAAAKRMGATVLNAWRILMAVALLGITHRLLSGLWIPHALPRQVLLLGASGLVGLTLGDLALFAAFVTIGPRMAMLIMTTSPLFAVLFGWWALDESLPAIAWVGIALTVGGVAWVVLERRREGANGHKDEGADHTRHRARGCLLAMIGSVCQAGGLLLSKQGMGHGWLPEDARIDPQAATLIRMVFAAVGMLPIMALYWFRARGNRLAQPARSGHLKSGLVFAAMGAFTGPFLGVWMSLVASDKTSLGVAQTLCSLAPVLILPIVVVVHKERVSMRAVVGAFIAVLGAALLFF